MQYYTPSIPAIECPPLVPDNTPVLVCPSCGDTMKHLRTTQNSERAWSSSFLSAPPASRSITKEGHRHAA